MFRRASPIRAAPALFATSWLLLCGPVAARDVGKILDEAEERFRRGNYAAARALYEKASRRGDGAAFAAGLGLSRALYMSGEYGESLAWAQRLPDLAEGAVETGLAWNRLGALQFEMASWKEHLPAEAAASGAELLARAEANLRKAIAVSGGRFAVAWFNLAETLLARDDVEGAALALDQYAALVDAERRPPRYDELERCFDYWLAGGDGAAEESDRVVRIRRPRKLRGVNPKYTRSAKAAKVTGRVVVEAIIDRDGSALCTKVLEGLPLGLSAAAASAVSDWTFSPATVDGAPVPVYYNLTVNYRLQPSGEPTPDLAGSASAPRAPYVRSLPRLARRSREPPPLPDGVQPLSAERRRDLAEVVEIAERLRGLESASPVPAGQQSEAELARQLRSKGGEEPEPNGHERVLRWFGLIPGDLDLDEFLVDLYSSQIGGYFDSRTGYVVLVDDSVPSQSASEGDATDEPTDKAVLLHEVVHYLQDLHFGSERPRHEVLDDRAAAFEALLEGDATLTMLSFLAGVDLARLSLFRPVLEAMLDSHDEALERTTDAPELDALEKAPAYFRETLKFPYVRGLFFGLALRQRGGTKLLDYAFELDPPRSTEQILHPEKWLDERDEPFVFTPPALAGARTTTEGSWGELGARLVLAERLDPADAERVDDAAAGWGGDRFALYSDPRGGEVLVWATQWDDPADADEFAALAAPAFPGWRLERAGELRVVLVDASDDSAAPLAAAALDAWLRAEGERAAQAPPNLAAIGVGEEDVPEPFSLLELFEIAEQLAGDAAEETAEDDPQSTRMQEILLADPEVQAAWGDLIGELSPEELRRLAEHPLMREVQPSVGGAPELVVDDTTLSVEGLGVSLALPPGEGWTIRHDLDANSVTARGVGANLLVRLFPLPPDAPLALVAAGVSAKLGAGGLEKTAEHTSTLAGRPVRQLSFSGGDRLGMVSVRLVHLGDVVLVLTLQWSSDVPPESLEALQASADSLVVDAES